MVNTLRVPRVMAAVLMSLALAASALVTLGGVTSAQEVPPDYELVITGVPDVAVAGQAFTVRVKILDGDYLATGCASTALVTLVARGDPGYWEDQRRARRAVATFRVTLGSAGMWDLRAEVLGEQCSGADFAFGADEVEVVPRGQPVAPCPPDATCDQDWNGSFTAATLIAATGSFTYGWDDWSPGQDCAQEPLDPVDGVLVFDHSGGSSKKIVFGLASHVVDKGIGRLRVCLNGEELVRCKKGDSGPCVLFAKATKHNGALVGIKVPPGDPRGYVW